MLKKYIFLLLIAVPSLSFSQVNYYQNSVAPGREVWEYIDKCNKTHRLSVEKQDFKNKDEKIMQWLKIVLKETKAKNC